MASVASAISRGSGAIATGPSLEGFVLIQDAMRRKEQVWGYLDGQCVRFCPHALGWREAEPYVLGLALEPRRDAPMEGGGWEWLLEWRWIRLADLRIPCARKGEWVTSPREQRPPASFLSAVYQELE